MFVTVFTTINDLLREYKRFLSLSFTLLGAVALEVCQCVDHDYSF